MTLFQAESKKSGDHFEEVVMSKLMDDGYVFIQKNVFIPEAGVEVDFFADGHYIEAKGGNDGDKKRPGAKRTDSVKKAIANGALIKAFKPDAHYKVYFSSMPIPNSSSDIMIKVALNAKIIDEVIYIENPLYTFDDLFDQWNWSGE
jgi:hypothetical protein